MENLKKKKLGSSPKHLASDFPRHLRVVSSLAGAHRSEESRYGGDDDGVIFLPLSRSRRRPRSLEASAIMA